MAIRFLIVLLSAVLLSATAPVQAEQWQPLGATTASLRTGGAHLVSSDALLLNDKKTALITYWEAPRGTKDQDVYRCVDVVAEDFSPISQSCWKVLTAAGRRPIISD